MLYDYELFKQGKHCIRLKTQEEWDTVMEELEELDINWASGVPATSNNRRWVKYGHNTAIYYSWSRAGLCYGSYEYYLTVYMLEKLLPLENKMKTIEELRDYLLENYVNAYGILDISCLDFGEFDGDINISGMKVKESLYQNSQEVGLNIHQGNQLVEGHLFQSSQIVKGNIFQNQHTVGVNLEQTNHRVESNLYQGYSKYGENIHEFSNEKLKQKMTHAELIDILGYDFELVEEETK